jgi:hypothetical protein
MHATDVTNVMFASVSHQSMQYMMPDGSPGENPEFSSFFLFEVCREFGYISAHFNDHQSSHTLTTTLIKTRTLLFHFYILIKEREE